ncbi:MAG: RimK/LysX family protein [Candidatus Bathyarchaeota archaeon]|nr:RimK/LysX family protein [Candidatus Bathyarchaeota archaeon]
MRLTPGGILGINARNQKFLRTPKKIRRILDSKLLTKKILQESSLPVLKTLNVIKTRRELFNFGWEDLPSAFALKPNRGLGGEGIIVVYGKKRGVPGLTWIRATSSFITRGEIEAHILDILDGNFSMFSLPDVAFFEERAKIIKEFKPYSFKGIPDIRIITYQRVPVMVMLRLPTKESGGRANLHSGGIGVGIDLATGITTNAIFNRKLIDYYPGTRYLLRGIKVPYFKQILNLAIQTQKVLRANFLGIDIVIDREKGPVILEVNTRPGLQIQLANLAGLIERIERVKDLRPTSEIRRARLAQDLFGESGEELDEIYRKKVLGTIEEVEIIPSLAGSCSQLSNYKTLAKIDTGAWRTSISLDIAKELGIQQFRAEKKVKSSFGEEARPIMPLAFILGDQRIETNVYVADRSSMKYEMIVGRRDLKNFIINPSNAHKF